MATPEGNPRGAAVERGLPMAGSGTRRSMLPRMCRCSPRRVVIRGSLVVPRRKESPLNTQSSTTVALRALVMLVCLVVVPVVAIFGTSIPDAVKRPVERYFGISLGSPPPLSEAPRFLPNAATAPPAVVSTDVPPAAMPPVASSAPLTPPNVAVLVNPLGSSQSPAWDADRASSAIIPAGYQAPVEPAKPGQPMVAVGGAPLQSPYGSDSTATVCPSAVSGENDRFTLIQQRLRDLGATYFLLESWGSQGQLYRFYCKMAIGGNSNYNRYFEATDPDAIRVMSKVLNEVEAWRASRR